MIARRPEPAKSGAYSWVKAPRYRGQPMEVGERNPPRGARAVLSKDGGKTWDVAGKIIQKKYLLRPATRQLGGSLEDTRVGLGNADLVT